MNGITVKEKNSKKGKIVLIIVILLIAAITALAMIGLSDSKGVNLNEPVKQILIEENADTMSVAAQLKNEGIIKYPYMFIAQSLVGGYHGNFQPGSLSIENGMSYGDILDLLIVPSRNTVKVVIAEGEELREISQKLNDMGIVPWQDFYGALDSTQYYDYPFLGNIPARDNLFEGYIYPATYEITYGMTSYNIAELMLDTFNTQFSWDYYEKAQELGITTDELIILASIVEREAPQNGDLNRIAGVYFNRYKAGFCLESTGSIQYILGERKPVLSIADTKTESPYNTFINPGLPAGPICSPGKDAIEAVLNHTQNNEYYYGLHEDGTTFFAQNYNEYITQLEQAPMMVSVDSDVFQNQDSKIPAQQ